MGVAFSFQRSIKLQQQVSDLALLLLTIIVFINHDGLGKNNHKKIWN